MHLSHDQPPHHHHGLRPHPHGLSPHVRFRQQRAVVQSRHLLVPPNCYCSDTLSDRLPADHRRNTTKRMMSGDRLFIVFVATWLTLLRTEKSFRRLWNGVPRPLERCSDGFGLYENGPQSSNNQRKPTKNQRKTNENPAKI